MPSNKLSGRRSTARKPSVCISIPPDAEYYKNFCHLRILWTDFLPTPPLVIIDETVQLDQDPPDGPRFYYANLTAGPGEIYLAEMYAPFDETNNQLTVHGMDEGGAEHIAEAYFAPPRPVPFNQTVELISYDYPQSGSVIAHVIPVQK